MSKADTWPDGWKQWGFNYCIDSAIDALKYLAENDRPSGGEQRFNAEHLYQIAQELVRTQEELLDRKA